MPTQIPESGAHSPAVTRAATPSQNAADMAAPSPALAAPSPAPPRPPLTPRIVSSPPVRMPVQIARSPAGAPLAPRPPLLRTPSPAARTPFSPARQPTTSPLAITATPPQALLPTPTRQTQPARPSPPNLTRAGGLCAEAPATLQTAAQQSQPPAPRGITPLLSCVYPSRRPVRRMLQRRIYNPGASSACDRRRNYSRTYSPDITRRRGCHRRRRSCLAQGAHSTEHADVHPTMICDAHSALDSPQKTPRTSLSPRRRTLSPS